MEGYIAVSPTNVTWYPAWRKYRKLHRVDGPAVVWFDGVKWWYLNGKRHRTDGPAIVAEHGYKEWYMDGIRLSEKKNSTKGERNGRICIG